MKNLDKIITHILILTWVGFGCSTLKAEVVITEFFILQADNSHAPQYVELYNNSDSPIDLRDWSITTLDDNGDVNGHTLIMTQTGITADVDVVQSGSYDNIATVTTTGDSQNLDINQTAGGTITLVSTGSTASAVKTININQTGHAVFTTAGDGLNGAGGSFDIDQTSTGTISLDQNGASANVSVNQTGTGTITLDLDGASGTYDIDSLNNSTITLTQDGASANYNILQTGGSGDTLIMTQNGASADVDIIQRD